MRDYDDYEEFHDDSVRLHTPVLQRVLILAAVIIAVPVVMWTITAFVRSYVARPKAPVLQHVAASETPALRAGSQAADQSAPAPQPGPQPGPQRAEAKAPPSAAAAPPTAPPVNTPAPGSVQTVSIQPPAPAPVPATVPAPAPATVPPGAVGRPGAASADAAPPAPTAATPAPALRTADTAPATSDRGLPWPNPNSTNPPSFGSAAPAAASTPLPRTAALEAVPASDPIRGPIPLPRHRPNIMASVSVTTGTIGETSGAPRGPVPLPRVRPGAAPAEAPPLATPGGYEPGLSGGG